MTFTFARCDRRRPAAAVLVLALALAAPPAFAQHVQNEVEVTATRLGGGIAGASTTIITSDEVMRSPALTLQELLARQPGIQIQSLYGMNAGARDVIDMRGFGAAASSNTLVLVNGRRLNDLDLAGIDYTAIPREAIERIEIIRGNAGGVLYGNGAVGGAINIVTKTGAGRPSAYGAEAAIGSYGYREGTMNASQSAGAFTFLFNGNTIDTASFRENNRLRQGNAVFEARHAGENGDLYVNLSADDQDLGLPAGRRVTLTGSQITGDRRGTATPRDFSDKQGLNLAFGGTRVLWDGGELVLDAGVRDKSQQSGFFSAFGAANDTYTDTRLRTWSLTPRINVEHTVLGQPAKGVAGIDFYHAFYKSDRMVHVNDAPNHHYDLNQRSFGFYGQNQIAATETTNVAFGARLEKIQMRARDRFDANAPGAAGQAAGLARDDDDAEYALHFGVEQKLAAPLTAFARFGRNLRVPNVDERVGTTGFGVPVTFALKPQTSRDIEGGLRAKWGDFEGQVGGYVMHLENELHFSPATFVNFNLDPTRRVGGETQGSYALTEALRLKGGLAYLRAEFRGGVNRGREVPLVSRWTSSLGASWDIWGPLAALDLDWRYAGSRRFDNDQANFQPRIPGYQLVDLRLGGRLEWATWSLGVQNLFDKEYFNYGIASATAYGTYNAFPLPGRTVTARLGVKL